MIRIYYSDGSVHECLDAEDWAKAPVSGVQVVVRFPQKDGLRWHAPKTGAIRDRDLWTGEDEYDPFGWGTKYGELISQSDYNKIWEKACGDSHP